MTVYNHIETILPLIGGWCSRAKAHHLAALIHASHAEWSVEIGVHAGKSAIPMACMHKAMQHGKLMAIDAWAPNPAILDQNEADAAYWGNPANHEMALKGFKQHLTVFGLNDYVDVVQQDSNDVAPPMSIDVLHIDGNLGPQTTLDVVRFAPHVRVGGYCVMDDLNWSNQGPAEAVTELEELGFRPLVTLCRNTTENVSQKDDYGVWQKIEHILV
jgi:predicted O-methyltransferase YrrM